MKSLSVLIVGGGGREHALAWKAIQSELVGKVWVAPGNAGTKTEAGIENVDINSQDIEGLVAFALDQSIDLTIIGPEAPLVAGICDRFQSSGLRCFGPSKKAAQLEGSKIFSKEFLARKNIPTADYRTFTDFDKAESYLQSADFPIVVKANGLASGKGVIIAEDFAQANEAVRQMLTEDRFGEAGAEVVIEEYLKGEEASFICIVSGTDILPMATSQDHKAAFDGDKGPNTGGMGAYSPAPVVDDEMYVTIMNRIMRPVVNGLAEDGMPYLGFLYAGLMIDQSGIPKVLEFNCRFGDPETQPIMMRMQSDLVAHCLAACDGKLVEQQTEWNQQPAVGVVLAALGYPGSVETGTTIKGLSTTFLNGKIFHAGTSSQNGSIITDGGRVLCATALGQTITEAQQNAYKLAALVSWEGCWYRRDIAYRAIEREKNLAS